MGWTYRVLKRTHAGYMGLPVTQYGIVEYYDGGGHTGLIKPVSFGEYEDDPTDEKCLESLRWQLTEMLKALDKPIVVADP